MAWIPTARQTAGRGERQKDGCLWRVLQVIAHLIHAHPFPCSLNYNKQCFKCRLVKVCVLVCFRYSVENQRVTARVCERRFVYSCVCISQGLYLCVSVLCKWCEWLPLCQRENATSIQWEVTIISSLLRWGDLKRQQTFNCPLRVNMYFIQLIVWKIISTTCEKKRFDCRMCENSSYVMTPYSH